MSSRSTVVLVAGVAVAGVVAYAAYFDYKRRNDGEFRKNIRKQKKRVEKLALSQAEAEAQANAVSSDDLLSAIEIVEREEQPQSPPERENYFMAQVGMGEQLAMQGPSLHLPAALSFFRALRVYPSPMELMVIYEKTVPQPIFKLVVQLMQMDVSPASQLDVLDDETSPVRGGPPSETSSQEWDNVTDPGASSTAL